MEGVGNVERERMCIIRNFIWRLRLEGNEITIWREYYGKMGKAGESGFVRWENGDRKEDGRRCDLIKFLTMEGRDIRTAQQQCYVSSKN